MSLPEFFALIDSIKQDLERASLIPGAQEIQGRVEGLENLIKEIDDRPPTLDDQTPMHWFVNVSGKNAEEKRAKVAEIKKLLGISEDQEIVLTRKELYQKASEISGIPIAQIIQNGADSEAQSLITAFRNPGTTGQGRLGSSDGALDKAFKEIVEQIKLGEYKPKKGVPLTKISQRAGANYNSANGWAVRRGFDFPMEIEKAIGLFS